MRRLLAAAAATLLLAPAATQALDVVHDDWTLSQFTAPSGTPVCVLMHLRRGDKPTRNLAIKGFANREFLVVTMYKETWQLDKGKTAVGIRFEDSPTLTLKANTDGPIVDLDLPVDLTFDMLTSVGKNVAMTVTFPELAEGRWVVPLREPRLATAFADCWARLKRPR